MPSPRREELDERRLAGAEDLLVKVLIGELKRRARACDAAEEEQRSRAARHDWKLSRLAAHLLETEPTC